MLLMRKTKSSSPCHSAACAIQACLSANDYQESRCQGVIANLIKCCEKHRDKEDAACAGILKRKKGSDSDNSGNNN